MVSSDHAPAEILAVTASLARVPSPAPENTQPALQEFKMELLGCFAKLDASLLEKATAVITPSHSPTSRIQI